MKTAETIATALGGKCNGTGCRGGAVRLAEPGDVLIVFEQASSFAEAKAE